MVVNDYYARYNLGSFLQFNIDYTNMRDIASETIIPLDYNLSCVTKMPGSDNKNIRAEVYFDKWFFDYWFKLSARCSYRWNKWTSQFEEYPKTINNSYSFRISTSCYISRKHNFKLSTSYEFVKGQNTNTQKIPTRQFLYVALDKSFKFGLNCKLSYSQQLNKSLKYYTSEAYEYSIDISNITKPEFSLMLSYSFGNTKVQHSGFGNIVNSSRMNF